MVREANVFIKVSEEEKELWQGNAKLADLNLSQFIRININKICGRATNPAARPWEKNKKTKTEQLYTKDFNAFWEIYPNKVGKAEAAKAWGKLTKQDHDEALTGIVMHSGRWEDEGTEKRFIPHPKTWLNQRRWEDEIKEERKEIKPVEHFEQYD